MAQMSFEMVREIRGVVDAYERSERERIERVRVARAGQSQRVGHNVSRGARAGEHEVE